MRRPLRRLHPAAWWVWALLLAAAASQTTDVLLLAVIAGVAAFMVVSHGPVGSGKVFRVYLLVAAFVLAVRLLFRVVVGGGGVGDALFTLPELPMPDWAVGIRIGGPVTAAEIMAGFADGARLATLIVCVGAANALADPRRMLRSLPRALHSVGTAVVVAVGLAPQLVASALRVRRAASVRRGEGRRLRRLVVPVIDDALDRTLGLAVAMESRGFGRPLERRTNRVFALSAAGLLLVLFGVVALLDGSTETWMGAGLLALGLVAAAWGLRVAGRRRAVTTYRPDQWMGHEWGVVLSGLVVLGVVLFIGSVDAQALHPSGMAAPPLAATLSAMVAVTPAYFAPNGGVGRGLGRLQPS